MSTAASRQQRTGPASSTTDSGAPGSLGKATAAGAVGSVLANAIIAAVARGPLGASDVFQPGATPAVDVPGFAVIPFSDGTMLELYAPQAVPAYGDNDGTAIAFRVDDVQTASEELAAAGAELLGEITRMSDIDYAYRQLRGPDGRVYGYQSEPQPAQG